MDPPLAMRLGALLVCAAIAGSGCGKSTTRAIEGPTSHLQAPPPDPDVKLHEQFHAAAFQAGEALDDLNRAVDGLRPLVGNEPEETKQALQHVVSALNGVGRTVDDYTDTPELAEIRRDRADESVRRAKGIEALSAAIQTVIDAQSTLDDLVASGPPPPIRQALQDANDAADSAEEALSEAVRQLGGTPPVSDSGAAATAPRKP